MDELCKRSNDQTGYRDHRLARIRYRHEPIGHGIGGAFLGCGRLGRHKPDRTWNNAGDAACEFDRRRCLGVFGSTCSAVAIIEACVRLGRAQHRVLLHFSTRIPTGACRLRKTCVCVGLLASSVQYSLGRYSGSTTYRSTQFHYGHARRHVVGLIRCAAMAKGTRERDGLRLRELCRLHPFRSVGGDQYPMEGSTHRGRTQSVANPVEAGHAGARCQRFAAAQLSIGLLDHPTFPRNSSAGSLQRMQSTQ